MKKRLIQLALILGLMVLTCAAAQATGADEPTYGFRVVTVEDAYASDVTLTPVDARNANVTKADVRYPGAVKMKIAYANAQSGKEYLLCVLADDESGVPTADNMAYIDQTTASGATVEFNAFPKAVDEKTTSVKYTVYLSSSASGADDSSEDVGITAFTPVATFEYYAAGASDVILGDLDGDGEPGVSDAVMVLQSVVDLITLTDEQKIAGDVNKSGGAPDVADAVAILQYVVDLISSFDDL